MKLVGIRMAASLALVLLLAACAVPGRLEKADIDSGKVIAVASWLGPTFHGMHLGTTIFTNESYEVDVPEWNIDGIAEQAMQYYLARSGPVRAFVLEHDRGIVNRFRGRHIPWGRTDETTAREYNYEEMTALARAQGADILIVLVPSTPDSVHLKPGYGFKERLLFGLNFRLTYMSGIFFVFSAKEPLI